jgi:hypothetical protein
MKMHNVPDGWWHEMLQKPSMSQKIFQIGLVGGLAEVQKIEQSDGMWNQCTRMPQMNRLVAAQQQPM